MILLSSFVFGPARAAQGYIGPVYIDRVSAIGLAVGGHLPGNMEVKVQGGFTVPSGVACNNIYITTLLSLAQTKKQPVYLMITDDPTYTAFSGRCSLMFVELAQ